MSGTTTSLPVNTALSPGFGTSTVSPRRITSMDLGIDPAGMSLESSCMRIFYQSTMVLSLLIRSHLTLLWHCSLEHLTGSVYLNCYSIFWTKAPHSKHWNVPKISSGFASVDLVTVPKMDIKRPREGVLSSLILFVEGKL